MNAPEQHAGAVDLGALKGPNESRKEAAIRELLNQVGLQCVCGNLIEENGIEVTALSEGLVPTPSGPSLGAQLKTISFCGRDCVMLDAILAGATKEKEVKKICIRPLRAVEWIKGLELQPEED